MTSIDSGSIASSHTASGDYASIASSVTSSSDYFLLGLDSSGSDKDLAVDVNNYGLIVYDGVQVGGYPHLLADRSNLAFGTMDADKQGLHISVMTSDDTASSNDWSVIEMDSATVNDNNMGSFTSGGFKATKRGGHYLVTVDARSNGNTIISAGISGSPHTQRSYISGGGSASVTLVVNIALNDVVSAMAYGDGGSRTIYADYTRLTVTFLGS